MSSAPSSSSTPAAPVWLVSAGAWLTPRRIRAHAVVLALCLWGVCAVDFATPGIFDRAGNIKFQDFLPLYVSARLIAQQRAAEIYDPLVTAQMMAQIIAEGTEKVTKEAAENAAPSRAAPMPAVSARRRVA